MSTTNDASVAPTASASTSAPAPIPGSSGFASIISESTTHIIAESGEGAHVGVLDSMNLDTILTREVLISNLTINGTELWNTNILGGTFDPFALFCANPLVASMLAPYSSIRADMQVKVVIKPPGSCMGSMVFTAICEGGARFSGDISDDNTADNVFTAFSDTYGVLSFEAANDLTFDLPFVYPLDYFPYQALGNFGLRSWRLAAYTVVPLQSMISTTAVANIKIYANFKPGYKLCNAFFQAGEATDGLAGFRKKGREMRDSAAKRVTSATGGHTISGMTSAVANVATSLAGAIPVIAPFAAPIAAGMSAISSVASWLGFTREALVYHPEPVVQRLVSNFATTDGVDTSERLVMLSDAVLSIDPQIGGGVSDDLLCFESLRRRWSLVTSFDLTTSSAVGKLFEVPVTPSLGGVYLGKIFLSPAGYYGLPFQFWRGGMEYMIYIPSSPNMRGGLQILWSPAVTLSGTLAAYSADPTNRLNNVILDLNCTQQHIIKVPYSSAQNMMENEIIAENKYANRTYQTCNGSLTFYLTSPYVAPRTGLISTKVLVLARPMADMVFAEPRWTINDIPLTAAIVMQSDKSEGVDPTGDVFETTIISAPMTSSFDVARELTSEVAPSARALMQKFTEVAIVGSPDFTMTAMVPPSNGITYSEWHQPSSLRDNSGLGAWTWCNHYAMMFTGFKGGCRVKITQAQPFISSDVGTNSTAHYQAPQVVLYATQCCATDDDVTAINQSMYIYDNAVTSKSRPCHNLVQSLTNSAACEFAFPYSSAFKYLYPRDLRVGIPDSSLARVRGEKLICVRGSVINSGAFPSLTNFVTIRVAHAGAEDVSVTRFRRVPGLIAAYLTPVV